MLFPRFSRKASARMLLLAALLGSLAFWFVGRRDLPTAQAQGQSNYKNFESPQVHPLALTPDGTRLLAVNSPEGRLSVFQLTGGGAPRLTAEIPVGLEPVSVAVRAGGREAWVVNWLSDSVSIVDLATGNVTRTLDVGDEPTDVLFAGDAGQLAFVCVSGTSQVKVFDAAQPSAPTQVINIRGKQPRSLSRDASGGQVFVSVFESGNQTTVVSANQVTAAGGAPPPQPQMSLGLPPAPRNGLIVKWNGSAWADERGDARWNNFLPYRLADVDVVVLRTTGAAATVAAEVRGVGTHVGNSVYDAAAGRLFVLNTESLNQVRFEPNLRGRFTRTRLSTVNVADGTATSSVDLNAHVNYDAPAGSDAERAQSLALPADIVRASDGTIYVAATGSAKVGVVNPSGAVEARIPVGQGPTGLALDEARSRLYVLNRFEESLSVVDAGARAETARVAVGFNPEPATVREGRRFLYDATLSAHGDVACASCHLNGHRDGLAWDLGDPQGTMQTVTSNGGIIGISLTSNFHPMKGPMTTQSLRGLTGTEPLHWRGDRTNLAAFNPAFVSLLGSPRQLSAEEMASFEAFARTLTYPPNPLQNLDRTLSNTSPSGANAVRGRQLFNTARLDGGVFTCSQCHTDAPGTGTNRSIIPAVLLQESQDFKVPQLRGLYQKTGMLNAPGEQLAGFGFAHDGTFDTLVSFLRAPVFTFINDTDRRDVAQYVLSFDSGIAPAVGLQATVNSENKSSAELNGRINLLISQANVRNCDLVVRGIFNDAHRSFLYSPASGLFQTDRSGEAALSKDALLAAARGGGELTFTGVPLGAGRHMSIDRNDNGTLDADEPPASINVGGQVKDTEGNPLAGVTVALTGSQTATTQTDAQGRFLFGYLSTAGTHTLTPSLAGRSFSPPSATLANPSSNQTLSFTGSIVAPNQIDGAQFFVRQHYLDFLNREPDPDGLNFWTGQITECGTNVGCREVRRINVSAAYFLSTEFQETGYLVYRFYQAAYGRRVQNTVPLTLQEFLPDVRQIGQGVIVNAPGWQQLLEQNKQAYAQTFVSRAEFLNEYPASISNEQFVDKLASHMTGSLSQTERDDIVARLNAGQLTRAQALRQIAEDADFYHVEYNRAFVLMQYFGYLRRNPFDAPEPTLDFAGYNFWLGKLESHGGNYITAEMVKAFITSGEYRQRFVQ